MDERTRSAVKAANDHRLLDLAGRLAAPNPVLEELFKREGVGGYPKPRKWWQFWRTKAHRSMKNADYWLRPAFSRAYFVASLMFVGLVGAAPTAWSPWFPLGNRVAMFLALGYILRLERRRLSREKAEAIATITEELMKASDPSAHHG